MCGISSSDLMPCTFKCRVTLAPQKLTEELRKQLLFTKREIQRWQKLNMLIVDNKGEMRYISPFLLFLCFSIYLSIYFFSLGAIIRV